MIMSINSCFSWQSQYRQSFAHQFGTGVWRWRDEKLATHEWRTKR